MARSGIVERGKCRHGSVTNVALLFMAMADSTQPNTTLYINNLNDKINKDEIRSQLYALFTTYGKLIDVVATKTPKMRGQAFLVFTDLPSATAALRACDGMIFYNKPMVRPCCSSPISYLLCHSPSQRISYAKSKSYATLRREDPNFVPPNLSHASSAKRLREAEESHTRSKRERMDEDDEEMDIDDDDDDDQAAPALTTSNSTSCIIFYCTQLLNRVYNFIFDSPSSTSSTFRKVALFKSPAGGHKWRPSGIISTVRIYSSHQFTIRI